MGTVAVTTSVLRWAIDRSNTSVEDLLSRLPKIEQWLAGAVQPTLPQLEEFSRVTSTPLGFLLLDAPPVDTLPFPHFRTIQDEAVDQPSVDLLETVYAMERRQAWMREYLIEDGSPPLAFVKSAHVDESADVVAKRMMLAIGFNRGWASQYAGWMEALKALREAIERIGVLTVFNGVVGNNNHRKLDVEEFRGFVLVDDYAPLVFVNGSDSKAAQMFTLAHELAHVFLGLSASFDLRQMMPSQDRMELFCNRVAAEFLVPHDELIAVWPNVRHDYQPFYQLARLFKVSQIVAARRALDLGLIDRDTFRKFYLAYRAAERQKAEDTSSGGQFLPLQNMRVGSRFALTVARALAEGKLQYTEAYSLTGLYGKTFEKYVDYASSVA